LFNEGGAHLLNSGVPLNLIPEGGSANYLVTGFWGARTHKESRKFGDINLVHELVKGNTKQTLFFQIFTKIVNQKEKYSFLLVFSFLTIQTISE